MVVYIDLIFAANLLIDAALLWLTGWMIKARIKWRRLCLSALVGALYVVMMFVPELSFMYTFLIKFGLSVVMLWVAFGYPSLQSFLRSMGAFYIINFAAAGGILGVHYLLQSSGDIWNGILYTTAGGYAYRLKIGFWFVLLILLPVLYGYRAVHSSRARREKLEAYIGTVQVEIEGVTVTCSGLLDTGNRLYDPLTKTPVMVMEASLWEAYLPKEWKGRLSREGADQLLLETDGQSFGWQDRLRLVPYRGVNRGASFMLALKPDQVAVTLGGETVLHRKVLIGLDGGTLSGDGAYRAIIHPDLAQGKPAAPPGGVA
ncbi:stage II sporulation protein GA (sporulation sigma-E factor processing peptidase) [Paenibacillus forsythiae]|uniref:Stage II sporulation protein GA (Sporulation sigma-E factor processing peptidase) n=1 Tax=Paenibacillus forsythiae TaxID=365616 RepID=A0ABU3H6N9_9BACL|nr:sigma-E processing peptidase SpoIIGA [Paenibacillus forsythiae]MDT3426493.1 stage II sporulation protein GA (sporulation sigma-E factor processing peptidase) [Paenibacillus forsythiae]